MSQIACKKVSHLSCKVTVVRVSNLELAVSGTGQELLEHLKREATFQSMGVVAQAFQMFEESKLPE